jgi:hypothetical protein
MSPSLNQIEQLKKELASGQVVVVVGSGVSVAACGQQLVEVHKVATWSGLLEHGVDRLSAIGAADGVVEMLHSMIRSGNTDFMINAAEIITDRFKTRSQGTFRGWLEETIGVLQLQDADLLRDIANLPGLVATLNEDIAATLKIFKECAQFDENWIVRGCAVGILSQFVNGDPDVLAIVKERAQSDKDKSVRLLSVQMLEEYWKDDLVIQAFLQGL